MKVLFIEPYPTEGPSSRYRVEQYIPYFRDSGVICQVRPFVSPAFYKILYRKGNYLKKIIYFIASSVRRFGDIFRAFYSDIVFIHLEAYPFGPPLFEWFIKMCNKKIIYDLDDAIYLGLTSSVNRAVKYLKCPSKINMIIMISGHVVTCNEYLGDYARGVNPNVTVISTSLDTSKFMPVKKAMNPGRLTIGWIGSYSTASYLDLIKDALLEVSGRYPFVLKIIGAGDYDIGINGPSIEVLRLKWELGDEIRQFQSLDIGIYPLPDDKWVLGKTGFKTMQYMSVGVPCVVSNVGRNKRIVQDGVNGFLAGTKKEWVDKISMLIENRELREKIGAAGRKTVEEKFSVKVNMPKYIEIFNNVYDKR